MTTPHGAVTGDQEVARKIPVDGRPCEQARLSDTWRPDQPQDRRAAVTLKERPNVLELCGPPDKVLGLRSEGVVKALDHVATLTTFSGDAVS